MAAAWEQAGRFSGPTNCSAPPPSAREGALPIYTKRILPLLVDLWSVLLIAPAAARLRVGPSITIRGAVRTSCVPIHVLSGAFRRITRPTTRRPVAGAGSDAVLNAGKIISRFAARDLAASAAAREERGRGSTCGLKKLAAADPKRFERLRRLMPLLNTLAKRARTRCPALDVGAVRQAIATGTDPRHTIAARIGARLQLPSNVSEPPKGVGTVLIAPRIPTPMYRPLVELGPEWLLPGLEAIPRETLAIVEPNRAFIESYMTGLNHEMSRELLWVSNRSARHGL